MANAFIERCKVVYAEMVAVQRARMEEWCIGYETEEALFYSEVEPRVLWRDVLRRVGCEWRAECDAELREREYWDVREAEFFAHEFEPVDVVPVGVHRSRAAAMVRWVLDHVSLNVVPVSLLTAPARWRNISSIKLVTRIAGPMFGGWQWKLTTLIMCPMWTIARCMSITSGRRPWRIGVSLTRWWNGSMPPITQSLITIRNGMCGRWCVVVLMRFTVSV